MGKLSNSTFVRIDAEQQKTAQNLDGMKAFMFDVGLASMPNAISRSREIEDQLRINVSMQSFFRFVSPVRGAIKM